MKRKRNTDHVDDLLPKDDAENRRRKRAKKKPTIKLTISLPPEEKVKLMEAFNNGKLDDLGVTAIEDACYDCGYCGAIRPAGSPCDCQEFYR